MLLQASVVGLGLLAASWVCVAANALPADAKEIVAKLDTEFQAAVKVNDASVMERILDEDMVLVHGNGSIDTRAELLEEARNKAIAYEKQDEDPGTRFDRNRRHCFLHDAPALAVGLILRYLLCLPIRFSARATAQRCLSSV